MEILAEIQRLAALNGGVPPGQRRFRSLTGIEAHQWSGKYWARWSDALAAAGFAPNPPQGAHTAELLFGSYIRLARELGHLPTERDLRVGRRHDGGLPGTRGFRRWGGKRDFLAALADHCRPRVGFDDILRLLATAPSRPPAAPTLSDPPTSGWVYLLKCGRHCKIGRTTNPSRREHVLSTQLPQRARMLHRIKTDDPAGIERYWHRRFADHRTNGEWFKLTAADIEAFKSRREM